MKKNLLRFLSLLLAVLVLLSSGSVAFAKKKKKKTTPLPFPVATAAVTPDAEAADADEDAVYAAFADAVYGADAPTPLPSPLTEGTRPAEVTGPVIEPQAIADYLFTHDCLPPNFITKQEAKDLGWDSRYNYVSDVAPGKSIGGDRFGNYEGTLPTVKGRKYYEADALYVSGRRGAHRIIYSSDGHVWYTKDHYNTFEELFPSDAGGGGKSFQ